MGVRTVGDLFIDGVLASFTQLQQQFNVCRLGIIYMHPHTSSLGNTSPSIIDKRLDQCKGSKKVLVIIYDLLQSFNSQKFLRKLRRIV